MKYNLIINGTKYATLPSIERLKQIGLRVKRVYRDAIVSIEDKRGVNIHYFF